MNSPDGKRPVPTRSATRGLEEREQFGVAYKRAFMITKRRLTRCGLNPADAEDYAQSGWVRAWERYGQLRDPESIVSWVNSIAIRLVLSDRRHAARIVPMSPEYEPTTAPAIKLELIDLERGLKQIDVKKRRILEGRYREGQSCEELARELRTSEQAVIGALWRARAALRDRIGVKKQTSVSTAQKRRNRKLYVAG